MSNEPSKPDDGEQPPLSTEDVAAISSGRKRPALPPPAPEEIIDVRAQIEERLRQNQGSIVTANGADLPEDAVPPTSMTKERLLTTNIPLEGTANSEQVIADVSRFTRGLLKPKIPNPDGGPICSHDEED